MIEPAGNNWWHLTFSIQDSQGLRLFLLSSATYIKVISPSNIRAYVQERLQQAVSLYAHD
jgi:predicted DNA-binding transcriptional regulator YafY